MAQLKITYVRSTIDCTVRVKQTMQALGLKKLHATAIHQDNQAIRGMIAKIPHLLKVEEIPDSDKKGR
jgi:large subunit ribosomal protein L30